MPKTTPEIPLKDSVPLHDADKYYFDVLPPETPNAAPTARLTSHIRIQTSRKGWDFLFEE